MLINQEHLFISCYQVIKEFVFAIKEFLPSFPCYTQKLLSGDLTLGQVQLRTRIG